MVSRREHVSIWRAARNAWRSIVGLTALVLLAAWMFRLHRGIASLEDTRSRILLTLIGLSVGLWLAGILAAGARKFPRTVVVGFVAIIVSQICYLTLVWSQWKPYVPLWRAWWISLVVAVTATHVTWLRLLAGSRRGLFAKYSPIAAIITAVLLAALALRRYVLEDVSAFYWLIVAIPAGVSLIGSVVLWMTARKARRKPPMPRWKKLTWLATAQAALFAVGFYMGRVTAPEPSVMDLSPSPLAHLAPAELDAQLVADLNRLKVLTTGIDDLARKAAEFAARLQETRAAQKRAYYLPAEEDQLRAQFMTYLAYRAALLRLVATYSGFQSVARPEARARCFLTGFGAGATAMRASTALVTSYAGDETLRRKLNEPDSACGIQSGEFDRIEAALVSDRNQQTFEEMSAYFEAHRESWRGVNVLPPEQFEWIESHILAALQDVRGRPLDVTRTKFRRLVRRIKEDAYTPIYDAQTMISTLIGDTRIVSRPPFISHEQIVQMQGELQPGDILLERRNWFTSNAFLPGFWPHAAIYVGTIDDLHRLKLVKQVGQRWTSEDPAIRDRLDGFLKLAHDGQPHTVIESVSEGVIFNSLTESMHADYVAVLRPRLSDAQKSVAIARAFSHEGKPYDFEFDFFSADKLVCTELVYRSYEGLLHFELVRIMGRDTLPALEICRKFSAERGRENREMDFVMFLDAVPAEGVARRVGEEEFCASAHRPRGFNE